MAQTSVQKTEPTFRLQVSWTELVVDNAVHLHLQYMMKREHDNDLRINAMSGVNVRSKAA